MRDEPGVGLNVVDPNLLAEKMAARIGASVRESVFLECLVENYRQENERLETELAEQRADLADLRTQLADRELADDPEITVPPEDAVPSSKAKEE